MPRGRPRRPMVPNFPVTITSRCLIGTVKNMARLTRTLRLELRLVRGVKVRQHHGQHCSIRTQVYVHAVSWFYDSRPRKKSRDCLYRIFHGFSTRGRMFWNQYLQILCFMQRTMERGRRCFGRELVSKLAITSKKKWEGEGCVQWLVVQKHPVPQCCVKCSSTTAKSDVVADNQCYGSEQYRPRLDHHALPTSPRLAL